MQELINAFVAIYPKYKNQLKVVQSENEIENNVCCFDISRRVYTKIYSEAEIAFLKAHVPLVKFYPNGEGSFFDNFQKIGNTVISVCLTTICNLFIH